MAYNFDNFQTSLQDLQRQYQQLASQQQLQQNQLQVPQIQQVQMPVITHQVQYVEGMAGAKLYQQKMAPNSSEIIMDKDDNIFYQVSKDANGTPSKKIIAGRFTIEDIQEEEPVFLTRKDFDDFKEELRQMFMEAPKPSTPAAPLKSTTTSSAKKA